MCTTDVDLRRTARSRHQSKQGCLRVVELSAIPKLPHIKKFHGKGLLRKTVSFPGLFFTGRRKEGRRPASY